MLKTVKLLTIFVFHDTYFPQDSLINSAGFTFDQFNVSMAAE